MKRLLVAAMASLAMLSFARADEGTGPEIVNVGEKGAVTYQDKTLTVANVAEGYIPIAFVDGAKVALTEGVYTVEGTDPAKIAVTYVKNTAWYLDPFVKNDVNIGHTSSGRVGVPTLNGDGSHLMMASDYNNTYAAYNDIYFYLLGTAEFDQLLGSYIGTPINSVKIHGGEAAQGIVDHQQESFNGYVECDDFILASPSQGGCHGGVPFVMPINGEWGGMTNGMAKIEPNPGDRYYPVKFDINNGTMPGAKGAGWPDGLQWFTRAVTSTDKQSIYFNIYARNEITKATVSKDANGKVSVMKSGIFWRTWTDESVHASHAANALALFNDGTKDIVLAALADGRLVKLDEETLSGNTYTNCYSVEKSEPAHVQDHKMIELAATGFACNTMYVTGVADGTPHLVCHFTDGNTKVYALNVDGTLASATPIVDIAATAYGAPKCWNSLAAQDDELVAYGAYNATGNYSHFTTITAKPAQVTVRGTFTTYEEGVNTMVNYGAAANVSFAAPEGTKIFAVKVNGTAVGLAEPTNEYVFVSAALSGNAYIEMQAGYAVETPVVVGGKGTVKLTQSGFVAKSGTITGTITGVAAGYVPVVFVDGVKVAVDPMTGAFEGVANGSAKVVATFVKNTAWYLDPFVKNDVNIGHTSSGRVGVPTLNGDGSHLMMASDYNNTYAAYNDIYFYLLGTAEFDQLIGGYIGTPINSVKIHGGEAAQGIVDHQQESFNGYVECGDFILASPSQGGCHGGVPFVMPINGSWGGVTNGMAKIEANPGDRYYPVKFDINNGTMPKATSASWPDGLQWFTRAVVSTDKQSIYFNIYARNEITKATVSKDANGKVSVMKSGIFWRTWTDESVHASHAANALALFNDGTKDIVLAALADGRLVKLDEETLSGNTYTNCYSVEKSEPAHVRDHKMVELAATGFACNTMYVTGVADGTPHLVCQFADNNTRVYALNMDGTLVSATPIVDIAATAYGAPKCWNSLAAQDDELVAYGAYDADGHYSHFGTITAKPAQVTVRGTFGTYEEGVDTMVDYGKAAEVPFTAPAGYVINSVKVNGAAVAGWTPATSYIFTDAALAKNVYIEMTTAVDPAVAEAKIGDTYFLTLREAVLAAQNGQTVTVLKDCRGKNGTAMDAAEWPATAITVSFTLDLDGHLVSIDGADRYAITVGDGATLTIADSSEDGEGELRNTGYMSPFILVKETGATGSHLVLNRGRITSTCATYNNRLIRIDDDYDAGSSFTMNGGEVSSPSTASAVIKSWYNSLTTINGGKVTGSVEANGSVEGAVVIPADSTALFDRDQTAFCATGYVTDEHGENEGGLAGWWFVTAGPKVAITYDYGDGTAPATANKAAFAAYTADRTFTLAQPTAPTGMKFKAWTADGVTFAGDVMTIPANFATAFTVTATYEAAGPVWPDLPDEFPADADAAVKAKYAAWATAYSVTAPAGASDAFLLNVDPTQAVPELEITSIEVADEVATIKVAADGVDLSKVNGVLFLEKSNDLKTWTTFQKPVDGEIVEGVWTVEVEAAKFMKAKVGFKTPVPEK